MTTTERIQSALPEINMWIDEEKMNLIKTGTYNKLFNVIESSRLQDISTGISAYQPMQEVGETGNAETDALLQGYTTVYNKKNYRKEVPFSKNLFITDQNANIETKAKSLPRTVEYSRDLWTQSVFRKAWDTSLVYGDSKQLISLAHPVKYDGSTQANTFLDGVQRALSYDNVKTLEDVLMSNVSNSGNLLNTLAKGKNRLLVVPYALREKAFQIAEVTVINDKKADTTDHNKNYFGLTQGAKYDVLVANFINYEAARQAGETTVAKTSASNYWDSMWFILDQELAMENMKMMVQPEYANGDYAEDFNYKNESIIKYAYDMYAFGVADYKHVAGSKGDGSTFSS